VKAVSEKPRKHESGKTTKKQKSPAAVKKPPVHKVNAGENLYRISIKHNTSMDEIMRANNLKDSNNIYTGMLLKIPQNVESVHADSEKSSSPQKPLFSWPVKKVLSFKEDGLEGVKSIGIIIAAPAGSSVQSSAQGMVQKIGYMRGYGNFVLVKHPDDYFTIYSYLEDIKVKEGQQVNRGSVLGRVDPDKKSMHFQIDHNGKPLNPLSHLPKKN
jgi:murein DD-endopeptidase MepM/ murein hydrolase activator NlpD